jgi:hypothetical protein
MSIKFVLVLALVLSLNALRISHDVKQTYSYAGVNHQKAAVLSHKQDDSNGDLSGDSTYGDLSGDSTYGDLSGDSTDGDLSGDSTDGDLSGDSTDGDYSSDSTDGDYSSDSTYGDLSDSGNDDGSDSSWDNT